MAAYFIAQIRITDPALFDEYRAQVPATIEAFGGRYLVRGGEYEVLEGGWPEYRHVILEFPSMEQARAWHGSESYAPLKQMRESASEGRAILIEGWAP
jgi:uncharacterized protein (DUF1330 family)